MEGKNKVNANKDSVNKQEVASTEQAIGNFRKGENAPYFVVASIDSYLVQTEDLIKPDLRLLKTDNALIILQGVPVNFIITSEDVLHSWSVPRFGIKVDAVPGRLSQSSVIVEVKGKYFGQCSELCGVNHGFMPIEVWVIDFLAYLNLEKYLFSDPVFLSENLLGIGIDKNIKIEVEGKMEMEEKKRRSSGFG